MNQQRSMRNGGVLHPEKTYELTDDAEISRAKSILILEDDVQLALMLKDALQSKNFAVTVVPSGAEGVKRILTEDFSAILCDMVMPNFPGDMFYRAVERARPHLCKRFIFMTGHQGDRKIEQFIRQIRGLILWKPFALPVLFEAIEVIGKRRS
jgi:CheY-like chemotaxis protein